MIEKEGRERVILLPGLSRRIARILEEEALGYATFDDFVLAAVRRELERAEKTSFFLREGSR
ncbi:MAG: hypothetical protein V3U30_04990 [Thermoplasmata archaeon]